MRRVWKTKLTVPVFTRAVMVGVLIAAAGCGDDSAAPQSHDSPSATSTNSKPIAPRKTAGEAESKTVTLSRPKLPGDVFFENPLAIAASSARLPAPPVPDKEMAATETPESTPSDKPATPKAKKIDWAKLLPADVLNAEMMEIRDFMDPWLKDVRAYNTSLTQLPPYLAEMTTLAIIATRHPDDVPWREGAKYVRALSAQAAASELSRGVASYKQVKEPFDKITKLLDGKKPEKLPETPDDVGYLLTTNFGALMQRLKVGRDDLRRNGGDESDFTKNAGELSRQTRIMAALGAVIANDDFGYGDNAKYQGYATELRKSALKASEASAAKDYAAFQEATNIVIQSCNRCHADFRT